MIKNKCKIIVTLIILVVVLLSNVNIVKAAGNFSVSAGKTSLNKGATTNLTIKATSCAGKFSISSSDSGIVSVSSPSEFIDSSSATVTLTAKSEGTATITVTASDVADTSENTVSGSKSVTITVKSNNNTTNSNDGNTNNNNNENKVNENKINENKVNQNKVNQNKVNQNNNTVKEPTFKSANETVYATGNINVRKSYSADSDLLGKLEKGESVTRTGVGDNGWSKVTYNGTTGYIKSSLITTEEPAKPSDKALKTLEITPEGLDPEFDPEITSYTLTVQPDVEKLDIKAAPNDEKATVEITGNEELKPGDNMVKITVTAQDETTRIYNINVKKQATEELALTTIEINGYTLSPKFSPSIYEYKLNVLDPSVTKLNVSAVANKENAKVQISGDSSLQDGENTIIITVESEDGTENATYKIYANKSAMATGTTNNKNNKPLYIGIGVIALVILLIIIIIIRSRKNRYEEDEYNNENPDDYFDLYGYSSKKQEKLIDNEKSESVENNNITEQDLENKLFGKLAEDDSVESSNTTTKNEDNFNYNPYVTKDIYGDYNQDIQNEPIYNNNSMIETSNITEMEDYQAEENYKTRRAKGKHSK
ncbi:MAG: cadherin-like beta sandwich domain-containing protein [Clostridia bacterium]|nr:cadherin-like beta sandwich domain-containing protein [Clostridia bacterium]